MVGVPRSNACIACRARRKGCDGGRPSCGQCIKRGVECPGYKREMKMVMVLPGSKTSSDRDSNASSTPSTDRASPSDQSMVVSSASSPQILPRSCLETAYRTQTCGAFFDAYLPRYSWTEAWPNLKTDLSVLPSTGWLQLAASAASTDSLLDNALTALAVAHFERFETRPDAFQSSMLYGRAMRELSRRLRSEDDCLSDTTLAGVMALTIYEIQAGTVTGASSWLSHVQGAVSLLRVRGYRNFMTTFGQRLYLGAMLDQLINSIGGRRRMAPLAQWADFHHDQSESSSDIQLFEILQEVPSIIEQADALDPGRRSDGGNDAETLLADISALTTKCQTFERRLTQWYTKLELDHGQQLQESSSSLSSSQPQSLFTLEPSTLYAQLPETSPLRIFPHFYCFANPAIAEQLLLYWAARLFIPRLLWCGDSSPSRSDGASNFTLESAFGHVARGLPALTTTMTETALHIAQSLEYFLHPDMGLMEVQVIGFPLNLSMAHFSAVGRKELLWYEVIRRRMRSMDGGVCQFLAEMVEMGGGLRGLKLLIA